MIQNKKVLISGASIAGTATAYWLHRHGFTPTVVERAPAIRTGGYKIDIRGAALEVAERMGIVDAARQAGTDMQGATLVDSAGQRIATMPADFAGGRDGADLEVMRGDLNQTLYELTRDKVEYLFDDSITAITETADGVHVTFERAPARTFDLVVGADGLHSNTRALTFGDESQFIHDLGYYVSIYTVPNHLNLDRWELMHLSPGRLAGMYSTRQDTEAKAMFMFASEPLHYDRRDTTQQKKLLAEAYAGSGWEVPQLMEAMEDTKDFYFDSISQVKLDRWAKGRTVLVGDSAYCASPASGQGTSLALVGAYVLAGELAAAGGDHHTGFASYQREMAEFVELNQQLAHSNIKGMVLKTTRGIWLATRMLKALPYLPWKNAITKKISETIHKAATAITIKAY